MKPNTSGWRVEAAYDFVDHASVDDIAWECLRRNRDYQKDYAALKRQRALGQPIPAELERRWGLRFRSPSSTSRR